MVEAGSNCSNCNSQFKVAYETCPICELREIVDLSEFEDKEDVRDGLLNKREELSASTEKYLGFQP